MRLTLRSLLSFLHGQTKPPRTEAIRDAVAANPFLSQLARHLGGLPGHSEISPLPYREKGEGKDPNLVAEYLDHALEDEAVVKLESQCFQSDRRLLDVVACHQVLTTGPTAPTAEAELLADLYALGNPPSSEKPHDPPQLEVRSYCSKKPASRAARRGIDAQPSARPEPQRADPFTPPSPPRRKRPVGLMLLVLVAPLTYAGAKWPDLWQPAWNSVLELAGAAAPSGETSEPSGPYTFAGTGEPVDEPEPPRFIDSQVRRVSAEQRRGALEETRFDAPLETTYDTETPSPLPAPPMRNLGEKPRPVLVGRDAGDAPSAWHAVNGLPLTGAKTLVVLPDAWFETQWDNGVRVQVAGGSWFRTVDPSAGIPATSSDMQNQPVWHLLSGEFHLLLPPQRSVTLWYQEQALRFRSADKPTEIALKTVPQQGAGVDLAQLTDNQSLFCHLLEGECQLRTEDDDWLTLSGRQNQPPNGYQLRNRSWELGASGGAQPTLLNSNSGESARLPERLRRTVSAMPGGDLISQLQELVETSDLVDSDTASRAWACRALMTLDHPGPFLKRLGDPNDPGGHSAQVDHLVDRMRQHPGFARTVRDELVSLYPGTGFSVYRLLCGYPVEEATDELIEQLRSLETRGLPQLSRVARYQRRKLTADEAP
ncbi:MAG: hypothetical protein WD045_14075 [Pirellulaceae bacterium]